MKELKRIIRYWGELLEERWRALSLKKQRRLMLRIFLGYALLNILVLVKVFYDIATSSTKMTVEHIENPVLRRPKPAVAPPDSILKKQKNKLYGK